MNIKKFANPVFLSLFVLLILGSISSGITSASGVSITDQNKNMNALLITTCIIGSLLFLGSLFLLAKSLTPAGLLLNGGVDFKQFYGIGIGTLIVSISIYGIVVNSSDKMTEDDKSDVNIRIASSLTSVSAFLLGLLIGKYTYEQN